MLPVGPEVAPKGKRSRDEDEMVQAHFVEVFAGKGVLTEAVRRMGLSCEEPNDVFSGGTDFRNHKQVEELKDLLVQRSRSTHRLVLHLAPPCASFSRARDRSKKTRLRSSSYPEGLPGKKSQTKEPNLVARKAYRLACWAADELEALVSLENPSRSYLWDLVRGERQADTNYEDAVFSPCLYGATYQKTTRLRCWNWIPEKLTTACSLKGDVFTCGRTQAEGHEVLEFTGKKTHTAAEYAPGVCKVWAEAISAATSTDVNPEVALETIELSSTGRVKRHCSRGAEEDSRKAVREREDQESRAGMRNPSDLEEGWPRLWSCMERVRGHLEESRQNILNYEG